MSDAGELLLMLYEHVWAVGPPAVAAALDATFGLRVAESVRCAACGEITQAGQYTQVG